MYPRVCSLALLCLLAFCPPKKLSAAETLADAPQGEATQDWTTQDRTAQNKTAQNKATQSKNPKDNILIFYQSDSSEVEKFRQALIPQLNTKMPDHSVSYLDLTNMTKRQLEQSLANSNNCAMGIGPAAIQKLLATRKSLNYFAVQVSRNLLDKLSRIYERLGIYVGGIYEEQPFHRQIYLSKAINPELSDIGILLNQKDKYYLPEYQWLAGQHTLNLNYRILHSSSAPERYLTDIARNDAYLLITNNSQLYMHSKLAALVLSSFHQQVKLIGNRYQDAKTGTLASIYTSPTTLAIEASSEFKALCEDKEKKLPRYANSFSVYVNQHIANNLNMKNLTENELSTKITRMETARHFDE